MQLEILDCLRKAGAPILCMDLAATLYNPCERQAPDEIPWAFYETVRRAAASLKRRGLALSGHPSSGRYGHECARAVYWLPEHKPPGLKRTLPAAAWEAVVLRVLADGAHTYTDTVVRVMNLLKGNRYEQERYRVPIMRAVRRLVSKGAIRDYIGEPEDLIGEHRILSVVKSEKEITSQQLIGKGA